jgi:NCAIR mutase (PurE)-related protein
LNEVCDNLQSFQKAGIHTTEQLTYLHTLDKATKANANATLDLGRALRDSIQNISLKLGRSEEDITDIRFAVEKQAKYSMAIRKIELFMIEIKFSIVQLQQSLDLTSVGKLSSTLINPYNLSELLPTSKFAFP